MTTLIFVIPGGAELLIILFVILLLMGGKKIPSLMKGFGQGLREFNQERTALKERHED